MRKGITPKGATKRWKYSKKGEDFWRNFNKVP